MEKISIIIPCKHVNDYVRECIRHCLKLDYNDFEILLLPDGKITEKFRKTRVMQTGPVKPSLKRNMGVEKSTGKIIALIDSDAFPRKDWLKNAVKHFRDDVGIVGGPNLIPENDTARQRASDDILSSKIGAGSFAVRYGVGKAQDVKELPSCNVLIRKDMFNKVGGFDTKFLTAEDSKLCFEVRKAGMKIIYSPDVVVFHHRRALFRPHLKQMWAYGRDKAVLVKSFFSRDKMIYFMPSLFVLFLAAGFMLSFLAVVPAIRTLYIALVALYLLAVLASSLAKSVKRTPLVFPGIILTHITYGIGFLYGLIKRG